MRNVFGARPDHPMGDAKEVRRLLEALPAHDAYKALEELSHWHHSVSHAEGFRPEQRLEVLLAIDDAAQSRVRRLSHEYLSAARPTRFQENRLWTHLHDYWRQTARAYSRVVDAAVRGGKPADPGKALWPALAVRALRSLAQQLKWQQLRYGPIEDAVWGLLNAAYLFAEQRQIADTASALYPGAPHSTPRWEFMRAAVLSVSAPDSLLPREIDLAERLIGELAEGFTLAAAPAAGLSFWLDLSRAAPPQRAAQIPPQSAGLRCFGPGAAQGTLRRMIERVEASGQAPDRLGVLEDAETALEVMRHLALVWSPVTAERRHARHSVKSRLSIAHGLDGVLAALGGASGAPDFEPAGAESWIVENVSAGGFGAKVTQWKGDWLKVGSLLAMQPEGGSNWVIGIVRRLNKLASQEARLGIQSVSRMPRVARFVLPGAGEAAGVLLGPTTPAGEVSIALPPGFYTTGQSLEASFGERQYVYLPLWPTERGEDFEIARFRELVRES